MSKKILSVNLNLCKGLLFILIIGTLIISNVSLFAQTQTNTGENPEGYSTIAFTKPISTSVIAKILNKANTDKSLHILSAKSKITIDNNEQHFALTNENQLAFSPFFKTYQNSHRALLDTIIVFKDEVSGTSDQTKQLVKPITSKYSKQQLEKTKKNSTKLKIDSITVSGSLKQLRTFKKSNFESLAKTVDIVNLKKYTADIQEINQQILTSKTEQDKSKIMNKAIEKIATEFNNNSTPVLPKVNLSQSQISNIDSLISKDKDGTVKIDNAKLTALGIKNEQIQEVRSAINQFNLLPTSTKDDSDLALAETMETSEFNKQLSEENTFADKIGNVIIGNVQVDAFGCQRRTVVYTRWWGAQFHLNDCVVNDLYLANGSIGTTTTILALTSCPIVCGAIAAIVAWNVIYITWLNAQCAGNGVMLNRSWSGQVWYWAVC